MDYRIFPPDGLTEARIRLPLSKSMSNRAIAIAALTPGCAMPEGLADCEDTRVMAAALADDAATEININGAGTAMRFLTALFAAREGRGAVTLDGSERMRRRPIGPLVDALRRCGAEIDYLGEEGFPPLKITGRRLEGGAVEIDSTVSSQFVSALLMVAPLMERGLTVTLAGDVSSEPYIGMTIAMMQRAGAVCDREDFRTLRVEPGGYSPAAALAIEADWSAAAFWYEIQALSSGFISLDRLAHPSIQGDSAAAEIFAGFGVVTDFDGEDGLTDLTASPDLTPRFNADMSAVPDLVLPVAVTCCMLRVPFRITGIATLRIKESDRIKALCSEMEKLGVVIDTEGADTIIWEGRILPVARMPEFDTHDDHRMAMALAPVALYVPGIVVRDAEVVNKSYPRFWHDLEAAGFTLVDASLPFDGEGPGAGEGAEGL